MRRKIILCNYLIEAKILKLKIFALKYLPTIKKLNKNLFSSSKESNELLP